MKKSRIILWLVVIATTTTGLALFLCAPASEDDLPHALTGLFRELHGASAMIAVGMFGYLVADHVQKKIHARNHRWDGYLHLVLWCLITVSGFLLYYPQDVLSKIDMSAVHWYAGIGLCILFPLHVMRKPMREHRRKKAARRIKPI